MSRNEEDQLLTRNMSWHGVALAVHLSLASQIEEVQIDNANIILVKLKESKTSVIVGSVYMPTRGQDEEFDTATAQLEMAIGDSGCNKVILVGDLNTDPTSEKKRKISWENFLKNTELVDNKTGRVTHKHKVTGALKELDRFVTRGLAPEIQVIMPDEACHSDHRPIFATIEVETTVTDVDEDFRPCETKVNLAELPMKEFKVETDKLANMMREIEWADLDDFNGVVSRAVWMLAIEMTGQARYKKVRGKQKKRRIYKIDRELYSQLRQARREYIKKGKVRGSAEWEFYTKAKKQLRHALRISSEAEDRDLEQSIIDASNTRSPRIYSLLKKIKHGRETEDILPSELSGYGRKYMSGSIIRGFRDLFEIQGQMDKEDRYDEDRLEMAKDLISIRRAMRWEDYEDGICVTKETFMKAVENLAKGKAQDSTGMSNDLLKLCGDGMLDLLYDYTCLCLELNDFGGHTRNYGKGTTIVKKPQKPINVIGNWRKIVSNNVLNNLVQYLLQASIESKIQKIQTQYQLGFTAGIPVMHAVIAREEIMSLSRKMGKTIFLLVLDLKSCFPRIPREQLMHLLSDIVTPQEWALISQIYIDTWSDVRVHGRRSDDLRQNIGTIEGGVLSTQLLKLFLSVLLTMLERAGFDSHVDFRTGEMRSGQLCVADDLLCYTWDEQTCRNMLYICQVWSNRYRATFSPEKSVVVIQRSPRDFALYDAFRIYGEALNIAVEAEHLGTPVVPGDNSASLTAGRLAKTRRSIFANISFYDRRNFLNQAVKIGIWSKIFKPTLLFSHETVHLKASQLRALETFQHKILRSVFGLTRRASKAKLRMIAGQQSLGLEIWKLRLTTLNGIFTRRTLARRYVIANLLADNKQSWSHRTASKLADWTDKDPIELLNNISREDFKIGAKGMIRGRGMSELLMEAGEGPFRPPLDVFDSINPLALSDFSHSSKREVAGWARAVTGDFARAYGAECPLCRSGRDDSRHLMSYACVVNISPTVHGAYKEILHCMRVNFPQHPINWSGVSEDQWLMFLVNPTNQALASLRVSREDLQYTGLDRHIRRYLHFKVQFRYELLRRRNITSVLGRTKRSDTINSQPGRD